jgi:hypothetical protein
MPDTSPPTHAALARLIQDVAHEVRRRRAEFFALRGLFVGAVLGALPLIFRETLGARALWIAGGCLLAGALGGALFGATRRVSPQEAARLADRGYGFEDRVATTLEWASHPDRSPLVAALVADTLGRVAGRPRQRLVTRRFPREARFVPVPLVLGLVLALAPPIPLPKGGLPSFSVTREEDEEQTRDRAGRLETDAKPRAPKRDVFPRADVQERTLAPRTGGGGPSQAGDLSAAFKDTSLASKSPDFNSFLKKGDERIRMLEQVDRLPDLQKDFTQSQYKMVFQKAKELRGGQRPDQVSPQKLRELLTEMERLGRKGGGGQGSMGGDIAEGMEALEGGQTERAMEAMERALGKMRQLDDQGKDGKGLRGGRESDRRGGARGRDNRAGGGPGDEGDWPEGEGSLPGRGKSPTPKGDPTARLRGNPFDVGVEGESRSGKKDGYDTNLLGRGAHMPSRMQYLGVVGQYRKMMEEAIAREQVPRDHQTHIKQYFQSLDER